MVVGVAGKYCSGKSAVVQYLASKGYFVIDVDQLGHQALCEKKDAVLQCFGSDILNQENNTIDRKKLGTRVFNSKTQMRNLESIVHPWMKQQVLLQVKAQSGKQIVVDSALLFPMGLDSVCDRILWIYTSWFRRLLRAFSRDTLSLPQILNRFCSQKKLQAKKSSASVDILTITNHGTLIQLYQKVDQALENAPNQRIRTNGKS